MHETASHTPAQLCRLLGTETRGHAISHAELVRWHRRRHGRAEEDS